MNVSYRWLRDLAPAIQEAPESLVERLAMLGAPVEDVVRPGAGLEDVVVARVVEAAAHPNADRLTLCQVDPGTGATLSVVCGAPNVEAGALYPFAPVGASLPGGVQIRKAKIRGEVSRGMLCSERELGLGRDAGGILRLPDGLRPGQPLIEALGLGDVRLVLEVTPNRPDLLSHVGVARELSPDGHHGIELPPFGDGARHGDVASPIVDFQRAGTDGSVGSDARVRIDDVVGCPRYIAAVIDEVTIRPSPDWLAARLRAIGQRPINNVVDATNYVLHELGQPLHAFDLDRLAGPEIIVRRATAGEGIVTLDGVERRLAADTLVIADAQHPVAIAGVMGGEESEVTATTRRVLLECAHFDPKSVRAAARVLGLSTDASYRFERGTDIEAMERAVHRVIELILTVAGGRVHGALDVYPSPQPAREVRLRPNRVAHLLGVEIPPAEIERLLTHIGFELREHGPDELTFAVPGFRHHDVTREVDLIEEVARRHGYDEVPSTLRAYRPNAVPEAPLFVVEDRLRALLAGHGLYEARGVPMAPEVAGAVPLLRPLSAEEGALRSTVLYGLLRAVERNLAHGVRDVRLFELGTVFQPAAPGEQPAEETRLAITLTGSREPRHWSAASTDYDLWDLKGLATEVTRALGLAPDRIAPLDVVPTELAVAGTFSPEHLIGVWSSTDELIGVGGAIASAALDAPAWAAPIFGLEARLLPAMAGRPRPRARPVPTQPASDRDLALLVALGVPSADVAATIREAAGPRLERAELFDVYEGSGVPDGLRSLAFRLVFRDPQRTLRDEEVDEAIDRVIQRLSHDHGIERRG